MSAALTKVGYRIVYTSGQSIDPMVTGQKGGQWIAVKTWDNGGPFYTQTAATVEEMKQDVVANAEG